MEYNYQYLINSMTGEINYSIIKRFNLKNPIYLPTASYGHFGRESYNENVEVYYEDENTWKKDCSNKIYKTVEFFPWEKLDYVGKIQTEFFV